MDITQRTDEQFAADVWRELLRVEGELVALGVHVHDRLQHVACDSPLWLKFISATTPPASKKNGKRWLKRGRKTFLVPSAKAVASERDLASAARLAISRSGAAAMPFDQEDTIRLDVIHDIDTDMVHVRVSKIGLLPERTPSGRPKNGKKLGTKRDTHGMIETIADALQGVVYPNDRQVDAGTWEKQR